MFNDDWNEICFLLSENIKQDIDESSFEKSVVQALRVLGWKQFSGDMEIRPSYQIGSVNRITPDIVIKSADNHKLFVIEIKQPALPFSSNFQQQLFSYMRQLKLEYGLLIGQGIQLFYDGNLSNQEDPVLLEIIRFERDSVEGNMFVKLFNKNYYSNDDLKAYTTDKLQKITRLELFGKLNSIILSDEYKNKIKELIKQDFIRNYDGELIDSVLSELNFNVSDRSIVKESSINESDYKLRNKIINNSEKRRAHDNSKYLFKGKVYGKNRLVLAVIKEYVNNNPAITFEQLKNIFPDSLQGSETFTTKADALSKKDRRNFTNPDELIFIQDQIIAVSTQWGIFNIPNFLQNCKRLNIDIEKVK